MTETEGNNQTNRDDDDGKSPSSVSVSDNNTSSLLLTEQLRKGTREVHDQSDKLVNLKLAMVLTSKPLYAEAISLFWPIYTELEILIEKHQHHPQLKFLFPLLPILRRSPNFINDISYLLDDDKTYVEELKNRRMVQKSEDGNYVTTTSSSTTTKSSIYYSPPELQEYIDRLRLISQSDNPVLLIAYINAMYGAIMAGGAIIKRAVQSAFSLSKSSNDGVEIFVVYLHNTQYKNIADFRNTMKRIINEDIAPTLSPTQHEQILKEANQVFIRNNKLVATVKDTRAFSIAWKRFQTCSSVIVVTILVVVLAIYWKKK